MFMRRVASDAMPRAWCPQGRLERRPGAPPVTRLGAGMAGHSRFLWAFWYFFMMRQDEYLRLTKSDLETGAVV